MRILTWHQDDAQRFVRIDLGINHTLIIRIWRPAIRHTWRGYDRTGRYYQDTRAIGF